MPRTINQPGLDLIMRFEGCRLTAYRDVAGIWTIGYGHTAGVQQGMTISQAEAQSYLQDDLQGAEQAVVSMTSSAPTNNNQYAAMVSLCFNIGPANFRSSSVLRFHRARNYEAAAGAFLLWDKATVDGALVEVQGLLNRREAEKALYLAAVAS
jgi:lysozyme